MHSIEWALMYIKIYVNFQQYWRQVEESQETRESNHITNIWNNVTEGGWEKGYWFEQFWKWTKSVRLLGRIGKRSPEWWWLKDKERKSLWKIEQRKVWGLEWGPQVEHTALLASPTYRGQAPGEEEKHIKRGAKIGLRLLFSLHLLVQHSLMP